MRAIHELDCDFQAVGICTCGTFNKCKRGGDAAFGLREHEANLKKLRELLQSEKANNAAPAAPAERVRGAEETHPTGGATTDV